MRIVEASDPSHEEKTQADGLEALFESLESPLLAYAYRLTQSIETSQDLVQESFMKLQRHFKHVKTPKPWLYRTIHNLAVNQHRKANRTFSIEQTKAPDIIISAASKDPELPPDESIVHQEALGLVRLSLKALDARSQKLVYLKFEKDMSYREIAKETGLSVSNVGYVLHHAIKSLALELKKIGVSE
jgi:RNA polymerase sigma factor (sigma-70 family)